MDIYGKALLDYQNKNYTEDIKTYSTIGGKDTYPLPYLFRNFKEMPKIEQVALNLSYGKILDVGCGSGSHSLYLQNKNNKILSIDISKGAVKTCKLRGLKNVELQNIWKLQNYKFDTILLLMNGAGMCGKLKTLPKFLLHLSSLLNKNGQILLDSTDVKYLYKNKTGDYNIDSNKNYYGETIFIMKYKNQKSLPFNWLYVDFNSLQLIAEDCNLECKLVVKDDTDSYLAKIYKKTTTTFV